MANKNHFDFDKIDHIYIDSQEGEIKMQGFIKTKDYYLLSRQGIILEKIKSRIDKLEKIGYKDELNINNMKFSKKLLLLFIEEVIFLDYYSVVLDDDGYYTLRMKNENTLLLLTFKNNNIHFYINSKEYSNSGDTTLEELFSSIDSSVYENFFIHAERIARGDGKMTIEEYLSDEPDIQVFFKLYRKYQELLLNRIAMLLCKCFNFEGNSDYGILYLKREGYKYNIYLNQGYICLEEDGNVRIDTIKKVDNIEQFISLIKDLIKDDGCIKGIPFVKD